jgi:hypothetical protein
MGSQVVTFRKSDTDMTDKAIQTSEGVYRSMSNCRPNNTNDKGGGTVKNIPSNLLIDDLTFGEDVEYRGGCADGKRQAIIGILEGVSTNFIVSTNAKTNVQEYLLKTTEIDCSERVTHIGVLDDYLFWIDGLGKLRKLNIVRAKLDISVDAFSADDLLIDKFPPLFPPTVAGLDDTSFIGNNIQNSIFQFTYAYVYTDKEESSFAPFSKSVLPVSSDDIIFTNNAIDVTLSTGGSEIIDIIVAVREGQNGDWKEVERLSKSDLSISDDTTYAYRFYNNKYTGGLDQSLVIDNTYNDVLQATTQSITRDNLLVYGGTLDGLEHPTDIALALTVTTEATAVRAATHKIGTTHSYGVVFRDENGRTTGVHAETDIYIPYFTSAIYRAAFSDTDTRSKVNWTISGTPPTWAETYSIVYLGNKDQSSFVQYSLAGIEDISRYTYLDLSYLNEYKQDESIYGGAPESIVEPYVFTEGDRIRFITDEDGVLLTEDLDYRILGSVVPVTDSAGNIFFTNNIYVNQFDWASRSIDNKSLFEIYTPKKEQSEDIYNEQANVYAVTAGAFTTLSSTVIDGDAYSFERNFIFYDLGSLISDETINYSSTLDTGIVPVLNVVNTADGIKSTTDSPNSLAGAFYQNSTGENVNIEISGNYNFRAEHDDGFDFVLRRTRTGSGRSTDFPITSQPNSDGGVYSSNSGEISFSIVLEDTEYVIFYLNQPNNSHLNVEAPLELDFSVKIYPEESSPTNEVFIESSNYSDVYPSDEHSIGRPYITLEEDITVKNNLLYTGKYFADTNIDDTNKINPLNVKNVPYEHGALNTTRVIGNTLKVLTPAKEISYYLGREEYADGSGTQTVFTTSPIGTINEYASDYGTENPESIMLNERNMYYYDRKNASIVRTSPNGQEIIERYGKRTYLREVTARINAATTYSVYIGYNDKNYEVIITFVIDGTPETVVFNEQTNEWTHGLQFANHEGMMHYGENLLAYYQGFPYVNEGGTTYNNFFGSNVDSEIQFVINEEPVRTKVMQGMSMQSTALWDVTVLAEPKYPFASGMYTEIDKGRFNLYEGIYFSDIPMNIRDVTGADDRGRFATGDPLRGRTAVVTMTNDSHTEINVDEVAVEYITSNIQ